MTTKKKAIYVPDRVRQLIMERKLTVEDMAKKINISKHTLQNTVNGVSNPKLDTLIKISEVFGVTLDWLCSEKEEGG